MYTLDGYPSPIVLDKKERAIPEIILESTSEILEEKEGKKYCFIITDNWC